MLTFDEMAKANKLRCESPAGFNHPIGSWSLSDWAVALCGEVGEAANVVKKLNRVRDGVPGNKVGKAQLRAQLKSEIGDAFIYMDLLCQSQGFTLEDAVRESFNARSALMGFPLRI